MNITGWKKRILIQNNNLRALARDAESKDPEYYKGAIDAFDMLEAIVLNDLFDSEAVKPSDEDMQYIAALYSFMLKIQKDLPELATKTQE